MNPSLEAVETYLRDQVHLIANAADADPEALRVAFRGLCDLGVMSLRRPDPYGGPNWSDSNFRTFQELVARFSGSLAFLQTQHQSAVSMLSKSDNENLKAEVLPKTHNGEFLMGIGFSQLRRPGDPILRATSTHEGFVLEGQAPWVTGLSFFHSWIVGAALPDGASVFLLVPFKEMDGLKIGEPMKLAAMESPQTVAIEFEQFFVSKRQLVFVKPPRWIHENDLINITVQGFFAIGCAMAGCDIVARAYESKSLEFIKTTHEKLVSEVNLCREAMKSSLEDGSEDLTTDEKLRVRAWAIDLAVRCAHAGIVATSGQSNSKKNDAQRVYREALVFSVSAQTVPIMQATLERLTRS